MLLILVSEHQMTEVHSELPACSQDALVAAVDASQWITAVSQAYFSKLREEFMTTQKELSCELFTCTISTYPLSIHIST